MYPQRIWNRVGPCSRGLLFFVALAVVPAAGAASLNTNGSTVVSVAPSASASERYAADEFCTWWKRATGQEPQRGTHTPATTNVWIGLDAVPPELRHAVPIDELGEDGLHIKTLHWHGRDHLAVVGGRQRGTLYGVYEFFERYFGIRWLTPDETYIPPAPQVLPTIDYRFIPSAFYRDISQRTFMTDPAFAVKHRMNGRFVNSQRIGGTGDVADHLGGKIDYANGFAGWGHTFFTFVHPDDYFDAHPEYFSEIHGQRQKHPSQLCLSNPNVVRLVIDKARAMLRAESHARIVSVSQMDWEYYCTCDACRALDEREGSPAGSLLHFVNQVADGIAGEFPDCFVDTYAYMYTQTPPKTLRARDNVIVRLCTFNNDFARRVDDRRSERNRRFARDVEGWSSRAKHLFVYDYLPNFNAFQQPNPNLHTIQPNYRYFVENGVTGLYAQGNPESPASEFEHLRAYIAAKAMWNPMIDGRAVMDEFITLYYGDAAPYIRRYIELIMERATRTNFPLTLFAPIDWMDYGTVVRADELFRLAFMNLPEGKYLDRLREAYLPVRFAALVASPRATRDRSRVVLERPPSLSLESYWDLLRFHGVTHLNDYPIEVMSETVSVTPPRRLEGTVHTVENEVLELWIIPEFSGAIVRLRDKQKRRDWLRGYTDLASGRDLAHDVIQHDERLIVGDPLMPARFEVADLSRNRIEMHAQPAPELHVTRTIELDPESLLVTTAIRNSSLEPVTLRAKFHPEFAMQRHDHPRVATRSETIWTPRHDTQDFSEGAFRVGLWAVDGADGWMLSDRYGRGLTADFTGPFASIYLHSARNPERVTLDLVTDELILPPGHTESWMIRLGTEVNPPINGEPHE